MVRESLMGAWSRCCSRRQKNRKAKAVQKIREAVDEIYGVRLRCSDVMVEKIVIANCNAIHQWKMNAEDIRSYLMFAALANGAMKTGGKQ